MRLLVSASSSRTEGCTTSAADCGSSSTCFANNAVEVVVNGWPDTKFELHKKEPTKLELQKNELTKLELHKLEPIQKRTL